MTVFTITLVCFRDGVHKHTWLCVSMLDAWMAEILEKNREKNWNEIFKSNR
jgi:hypothetical protein